MEMEFAVKWPQRINEVGNGPTFVINKMYQSMEQEHGLHLNRYAANHEILYGLNWDGHGEQQKPKIHQMQNGRYWQSGMSICPVVRYHNQVPFQFAPVLQCIGVQDLKVLYYEGFYLPFVLVDGRELRIQEVRELILNEGFESIFHFLNYYDTDFIGQLVHWTAKTY